MYIEVNKPGLGTLVWQLPQELTERLEALPAEEREKLLAWMQRQTEGFVIALHMLPVVPQFAEELQGGIHQLVQRAVQLARA